MAELNPAPPPGHPERHLWDPSDPELGPIGLVLSTVYEMGAAFDIDTLTIHQHGEVNTTFLEVPYNHLRKALSNHLVRARSIAAQRQRTLNTELMERDIAVYKFAYRKLATAF